MATSENSRKWLWKEELLMESCLKVSTPIDGREPLHMMFKLLDIKLKVLKQNKINECFPDRYLILVKIMRRTRIKGTKFIYFLLCEYFSILSPLKYQYIYRFHSELYLTQFLRCILFLFFIKYL